MNSSESWEHICVEVDMSRLAEVDLLSQLTCQYEIDDSPVSNSNLPRVEFPSLYVENSPVSVQYLEG